MFYLSETLRQIAVAFDNSVTIELISLATTVLIVNRLYQHRETEREKKRLILQMGSPDNAFAREAVRTLRSRGWLEDGSLKGAYLWGANLQEADLESANLQGADLGYANLQNAFLGAANLQGADLQLTDLQKVFLNSADLQDANLVEADLRWTSLVHANLKGAKLALAIHLEDANLNGAEYNNATTWPAGFTRPPEAINVDAETNVEDWS